MLDLIIIGAGPAGLRAAALCERRGIELVVLERKKEIGVPLQCSGLVSTNLDRFVKPSSGFIEHRVRGAVLHSPGGKTVELKKAGTAAYVIDRTRFDQHLERQVKSEIKGGVAAVGIKFGRNCAVKTTSGSLESGFVFGCDGPASSTARTIGCHPSEIVQGIIAIEERPDSSDSVEMWFDKNLAPGGFAWKIPRGSRTEYGMVCKRACFKRLEGFFSIRPGYVRHGGMLPVGPPKTTCTEKCLLIGDAAAQVKPWSYGGVIYSMICAEIAANILQNALKNKDNGNLLGYDAAWRSKLEKNIVLGMMFREFLKDASNKEIDAMFEKMSSFGSRINDFDMDLPYLNTV